MNCVKQLKKNIRKEALLSRDSLSIVQHKVNSLKIAEIAYQSIPVSSGDIVAGFWPINSEVDVLPTLFALFEKGARLCLPVRFDKRTILFRAFIPGFPLVDVGWKTKGPQETMPILEPDILLLPLVAFDLYGNRIGYGSGFYDRFLHTMSEKGKKNWPIGVAFDCQCVNPIVVEKHDIPMKSVLTETGLKDFFCRKR